MLSASYPSRFLEGLAVEGVAVWPGLLVEPTQCLYIQTGPEIKLLEIVQISASESLVYDCLSRISC